MNGRTAARWATATIASAVASILTAGVSTADSAADTFAALAAAIPRADVAGTYAPFGYSSPTLGCESEGPFTFTASSNAGNGTAAPQPGVIRLQATPAHSGAPMSTDLTVAWLNVASGAKGIARLDETSSTGIPSLAADIATGSGPVVASLQGSVTYNDAICRAAPTVGVFVTD